MVCVPQGLLDAVVRPKAPVMRPSKRINPVKVGTACQLDRPVASRAAPQSVASEESALSDQAAAITAFADTTPPLAPTQLVAQAQSISTISAQWNPAQDPESGIASYVFAVGTTNTGTPTAIVKRALVAGHLFDEHLGEPQPGSEPHLLRLGAGDERGRARQPHRHE